MDGLDEFLWVELPSIGPPFFLAGKKKIEI